MNIRIRAVARAAIVLAVVALSPAAFGATRTWDAGGGDEFWSNALNWSSNTLPTSSDDVIITTAGTGTVRVDVNPTVKSITVQNGAELRIESGQVLTVTNSSTVNTGGLLHLVGGDLAGNGNLTVNGEIAVNASTLGGSGAVTIASSGVMSIGSTSSSPVISRSITNSGTITFVNTSTQDTTFDGATLDNTGTIDFQNNFDLNSDPGSHIINNNSGGLIVKSSGSGTTEVNLTVNNAAGATIQTQTGDMELNGGGTVSGTYSIASAHFIRLRAGTYSMSGTPTISGAGLLRMDGATLDAGAGVNVTIPNFTLGSGTITGPGAVHVSGDFVWRAGTITGSGPRVLNSTSVPNIACDTGNCMLDGATLQLQASATFSASTNVLVFSNGASLIIDPGKTLNITTDGSFSSGAGAASTIINNGTIVKTTTSGISTLGVTTQLSGTSTVSLITGTLQFGGGVNVASGATLNIASGKTLEVTGGVFQFNSGAVSMPGSGTVKVSAGWLRFAPAITMTIPNLTLQGGVIDGTGGLHVSGNFAWSGGTIGDSGARVLDSTSTPTISCSTANCLLDVATLQLQASTTFSASSNPFVFSNGASLIIDPGKTLSITNNGALTPGAFGGSVTNNGTIWKNTAAGSSTMGVLVTMLGTSTVDLDAGTMQFGGGAYVASGATIDIAAGTTLEVTSGVFQFNSGAVSMPGSGAFKVSGGTLRVPTAITMTIPNVTLQGSGVIDGGGTLILSGTTFWTGGTMGSATAQGGTTQIDSGNSLNITNTGPTTLTQNRIVLNNGSVGYGGVAPNLLTMSANSRIINNGTLNLPVGGGINLSGSATIENNGSIAKNTSGTTTIQPRVENNNGATVSATTGTIALSGGGIAAGVYSITFPAILRLAGGTFTVATTATVTSTGTFDISGATLDAGAGVNLTCPNLALQSGGTITGAGAVGVSGAFLWSAGTIAGSGPRVLTSTSMSTISCSTGNCVLDGAALQLQASANFTASSNALVFSNGASLTIDPGKTLSITNDGNFSSGSGAASSIINNGTLNKNGGTGTSTLAPAVNNAGTVSATTGTLALAGGGTHTGSFTVTAPANLSFSTGTHSMSAGSFGGTGTLLFSGATVTAGIPVNVATMNVSAGTATLNANGSVNAFTMTGGILGGSGTLTLNNGGSWSGGTMSGSGTTIIPATKTLGISAPVTLNSRTLQNDGTLSVSANVAGSGTIANNGTLNALGTITIGAAVNNSGQIATSGTLALAGGGTNSGSINVTSPGNISFTSGTLFVSGGSMGGTGTLTFSGATATVGVPVNVSTLNVTAGTATLNANGSADAFTMTGGTIGGSGTLTLNNGGSWSGGTMSGTTINPATKSLSISAPVTLNSTLQNNGTLNVNGNMAGSGTIANNGTLNTGANVTIGPTVNNGGQVSTSALLSLSGNGTHSGTFTASGPASVIDFSGGTQTISGAFAGTGKFRFSGAAATVNGTWSGMAIEVTGGSVALNTSGTLPALTLSGGTLAGSGALTVTGLSTWSGGTIGGSGALTFDAGATVTMPGTNATTLARPLLNSGTINFTAASSAMLIDNVPVTNNGTFDIQSSQGIMVTAGTPPFSNSGTLKKSAGAGAMQFAAPLMNSGVVEIDAGTLNFSGTYAQSAGTTDVRPGATLQTAALSLNGGALVGNGTIAGTVANHAVVAPGASPGTLTINGDYVQAANGTLDIQLGGTTPGTQYDRLAVSGTVTLDGTLNVTTVGGFVPAVGNAFQFLTYGARANVSTFATTNGLDNDPTTMLVPIYGVNDVQLITNNVQADIFVAVSAPPSVTNGSAFTYTVTVLNQGGSNATGVNFTATLPPNVTFNSASPAICGGAPSLVCTVGLLPNQSSATVVLSVRADGSGAAPLTIFAGGNEFDQNTVNNSASVSTSITAAADLRIAVAGTASALAGSRTIYTITVTNSGPDIANAAVSAAASPGLTFRANSGACTGSFPCSLSALSSGQSATIVSAWDISATAAGSVQLTVHAASPAADPNSSDNSASSTTLVGTCPAIVIDAAAELRSGSSAAATATPFGGAVYHWSISDGTIDSGEGTNMITFTAGAEGTATLAVNVTGGGCTLSAISPITVKPRHTCQGTAAPLVPGDGTTTTDALVTFRWTNVDGASGYRLWLQQGDAPPQSLGKANDTSLTIVIPPGAHHWYVETLFDGCASHESEHVALTIPPAKDCDTHGTPQLSAPANDATSTSASVAFSWDAVAKAIEYELWLVPAGGTPTLTHAAADTSYTATVPPGRLEWYVRAIFGGCAATESAHRTFTYTPPPECTSQSPLLIAPAEGERLTSPVSFEWRSVPGATSYQLYVDGLLAATTTSPHASGITVPLDERRWRVRARLAEGCGALDSVESTFVVISTPPSCTPLEPPVLTAPAQISSGVTGRIQWTFVGGATDYVVQISTDPQFSPVATDTSIVTTRQLPFNFTNEGSVPAARYIRVYAVDTKCISGGKGPFSPVSVVSVLPRSGSEGVALMSDPTDVPYTLGIGAELAGLSFTAVPTTSWITVEPASGIVPPGGLTLHAFAHTAGLPPGASTGSVLITTSEGAGKVGTRGDTSTSTSITLNNVTGTTNQANSTPPPDALTIPAVANVSNFSVTFQSNVCITNTSADAIEYQINFIPTGPGGITKGLTFNTTIASGATQALNSIVRSWLDGVSSSGTLQIRPITQSNTPASSAPATGLAARTTFASSRTFNVASTGGTFGQYVPVVPYANYVSSGKVISLQQIAQSGKFRTNLGLVEGSGQQVTVQVQIFDPAGTKLAGFNEELTGGQYTQLNEVLTKHGVAALDDGRIEVAVVKGAGKITAYASVIGNDVNNDALLVPPATIGDAGHSKWVVPGVTELTGGSNNWHTDVRIFNSGKDPAVLTLVFYSGNGGTATSRTITLAAGKVQQLDRVLSSFFGISEDAGGALHVSSAAPAHLVVTARTYNETVQGAYGQFIPAVTPEEAVSAGSRPLQILQVEQSERYRSNVGFAEVTGKPVTLQVSVFRANSNEPVLREVQLGPNQFVQFDSFLTTLGLTDIFNARISVGVLRGEGRATAYVSLIDTKTSDPTYLPGQ
jgi:uncharacterized repeat protein (TIGR01451 family)